jgi:hypothetical protein
MDLNSKALFKSMQQLGELWRSFKVGYQADEPRVLLRITSRTHEDAYGVQQVTSDEIGIWYEITFRSRSVVIVSSCL